MPKRYCGSDRGGQWGDTIFLMWQRVAGGIIPLTLLAAGCGGPHDVTADWTVASQPAATATTVAAVVEERACSSGRPAAGRIEKPDISTCQGVRGSAYGVALSQPVDSRRLLNGGTRPATPAVN